MPGTLYLIPNTLGQPADELPDLLTSIIPPTVLQRTASLDYFIAENAKTTRAFLKLVARNAPLIRPLQEIRIHELDKHGQQRDLAALLQPVLDGTDAGLISEAGVPAVADPGADVVRLAHAKGIPVRPLVGPSSLLLALMASGLNGQSFAFHGYLPTDAGERGKRIRLLEERSRNDNQTQLFIETPYRNQAMLEALATQLRADTMLCVATDLSLPTEEILTKSAGKWRSDLTSARVAALQKRPSVFLLLAAR